LTHSIRSIDVRLTYLFNGLLRGRFIAAAAAEAQNERKR